MAPGKSQVRLYFRLHPGQSINTALVLGFLRELKRQLGQPVALVWDNLTAHRSRLVRDFLDASPGSAAFFLPPYAPELNPVEYLWSYLKTNSLANFATDELDSLTAATRKSGHSLQRKEYLLRSFINHSPLPLRLR